jgi:hypothetical protein
MDNKLLFLKELSQLTNKYGIYINGCGCCGSPYLTDEEPEFEGDGELKWDIEKREYTWESNY